MEISETRTESRRQGSKWPRRAREGCFWLLIAILAWAPFPLGSNREWSWGLLSILVAGCWLLWTVWAVSSPEIQRRNLKQAWPPLAPAALSLVWAVVQILPGVPASWVHPLWASTANILGRPIAGTVSLNPWRTFNEITKLSTYIAVAWMAFTLTRDEGRANRLLTAWIAIGAFYAIYAFVISLFGTEQFRIFYALDPLLKILSGPFVQRNSFATYEGLAAIAAIARLFELGQRKILASKGGRRLALTTLKFLLGSDVPLFIASALSVSALIASASRGGFISTLSALAVMALIAAFLPRRKKNWRILLAAGASALLLMGILAWISGGALSDHFLDSGGDVSNGINLRETLWNANERMIGSAPFLGLGLGTFQDAYPMYAAHVFPYIMDKAHNDYLEFAAGLGLPAAISWWVAFSWLVGKFLRAVFTRKKDRIYPLIGIGATVLVAVHSLVDFSLQMPAVAVTYAALLGLALAQSYSSRPPRLNGPVI